MIYPSADTIEDRVGSRYSLVVLAAKRAKQIKEGAPVLIETPSTNPLTIALEEIAAGKVSAQTDTAAMAAHTADSHVTETPAANPELPAATRPLAVDEFDPALGGPGAAEE
ncbi:MAG: DNA-directed RNA polymerase subunit omega [Armatimonadetes bacterium]|nr:DNA-directed RNA polymerase subunit omega [Armatimonadota bacterium]